MLKDRRKPWQKKTAAKWSRCGSQIKDGLPERSGASVGQLRLAVAHYVEHYHGNDSALRAMVRRMSIVELDRLNYALAWSRAWSRPYADCLAMMEGTDSALAAPALPLDIPAAA